MHTQRSYQIAKSARYHLAKSASSLPGVGAGVGAGPGAVLLIPRPQ